MISTDQIIKNCEAQSVAIEKMFALDHKFFAEATKGTSFQDIELLQGNPTPNGLDPVNLLVESEWFCARRVSYHVQPSTALEEMYGRLYQMAINTITKLADERKKSGKRLAVDCDLEGLFGKWELVRGKHDAFRYALKVRFNWVN